MKTLNRTIVAALIYSKDNKILMGKQDPKGDGVYIDCWHIPGGGVEQNETQVQAVIREVQEEVGLDVSKYKITFVQDTDKGSVIKKLSDGQKIRVNMQFNVYQINIDDLKSNDIKLSLNDEEFVEVRWFKIDELQKIKMTPPSTRYFKKIGYIT